MSVTVKRKSANGGLKSLEKVMKVISSYEVATGIHAREGKKTYPKGGPTVAAVATYNEFGTRHMPERSYLRSTFRIKKKEIGSMISRFMGNFMASEARGQEATIKRVLGDIGAKTSRLVLDRFDRSMSWAAPNAPYTVRVKGFNYPLHHTGRLRKAIRWSVRKNGSVIKRGKPK